jgi:glycosyltransferase involved in cell wall biosynthesis
MRVAIIGIKAIPAQFGGFETAVDEISRGLVKCGDHVTVYNRSGMATVRGKSYGGVRLVTLPTIQTKNLSTIVHAFLSSLHAAFTKVDIVHYFTTGTTLFAPLVRITGKKAVCSVDGTDWQRGKWGRLARWYLRLSEKLAVQFCNGLISDSKDVRNYYQKVHGAESCCITYGIRETRAHSSETVERFGLGERDYVLFVGRLVPENNVHQLIRAFEQVTTDKKLVIVGDDPWEREYIRGLKATSDRRIIFTGGIYGDGYAQLQQNAYLFVLPDEVGGTHPALVEAMGFGNCVLVNDTPSNVEVIADAGASYSGTEGVASLRRELQHLVNNPSIVEEYRHRACRRAQENFRWESVVRQHRHFYKSVLESNGSAVQAPVCQPAHQPEASVQESK